MKSLHTYQEEIKARWQAKFDYRFRGNPPLLAVDPQKAEAFLKDATTQAYLLGLQRAVELLPKGHPRFSAAPNGDGADLAVAVIGTRNTILAEIESALTEEINSIETAPQ